MLYKALSTQDLARLQKGLGYTGSQMAKLLGLANDKQYRKYTGGKTPRVVSKHMLFWAMAHRVLKQKDIELVYEAMRESGAVIDPDADPDPEQQDQDGGPQP
jgi:hypothetical protein